MRPPQFYIVRGLTGSLTELIQAFGVQVAESTVRVRMRPSSTGGKGWDVERALLYGGRKPPLRADNPLPIVRGDTTVWERAAQAAQKRFGGTTREILATLVALGHTRESIADLTDLRLTRQHYAALKGRAEALRAAGEAIKQHETATLPAEQLRRKWRARGTQRQHVQGVTKTWQESAPPPG